MFGDIDIKVHCGAGEIMTKNGSRAQIKICGFLIRKVGEYNKAQVYLGEIPMERPSGKIPKVAMFRYSGEIHQSFYGFIHLVFVIVYYLNYYEATHEYIDTIGKNDNSIDVEHVRAITSVTNEGWLNCPHRE